MNYRLLSRMLGIICSLFAVTMLFSLPWAHPGLGLRIDPNLPLPETTEWQGIRGLIGSCLISAAVGGLLMWLGRGEKGQKLFRKEAMATVGLAWVLATILGSLPYLLSGTKTAIDTPITIADALF